VFSFRIDDIMRHAFISMFAGKFWPTEEAALQASNMLPTHHSAWQHKITYVISVWKPRSKLRGMGQY